jgi:predicted tellurium resistance membrane protein TerC
VVPFVKGILEITALDLTLSGDNALGIGAIAAKLEDPGEQQRAIRSGVRIALILRLLGLGVVNILFAIPLLINIGSLWIIWVAVNMAMEVSRSPSGSSEENEGRLQAFVMRKLLRKQFTPYKEVRLKIALTDFSLSLENLAGISAIAQGNWVVAIAGTLLSILILWKLSSGVARIISRLPWLLYVAAAWLAVVGAGMTVKGLRLTSLETWGVRGVALLTVVPFIIRHSWRCLRQRRRSGGHQPD